MTDQQRKQILNSFANAGTSYRGSVYHEPMGADRTAVALTSLIETLKTATQMVDQTIRENRRDDGLYHSYNVLHLGADTAKIDHLYEMLEGQVAVINSGLLSSSEIADLLDSLRASKMYRADQDSYLLYPDRELPAFTEKNQVSASAANQCELLQRLLKNEDKTVMLGDAEGMLHFNGDFRNAYDLDDALNRLKDDDRYCDLVNTESRQAIHALWEDTFEHRHFTGRSGTFFGYEGLGSIYWHMVSKLSLAVIEQCVAENERGVESDAPAVDRLMAHYREIRGGLGIHKSPSEYGAFPQDPYSHTPEGRGAQQPGMTGQVKEDILSRWHELGIQVANGTVKFHPVFFEASEFLDESKAFEHIGINGKLHRSTVPANGFAFTYCQTLIVYQRGKSPSLTLHLANGETVTRSEPSLSAIETQSLFSRSGEINKIEVQIAEA